MKVKCHCNSAFNSLFVIVITTLTGISLAELVVELDAEPEVNLFLESANYDFESRTDIRHFTLVQPTSSVTVKSSFGHLTAQQTLRATYTDITRRSDTNSSHDKIQYSAAHQSRALVLNGEISAHLVTKQLRPSNPVLRVLFYAGHTSADYAQRSRDAICAAVLLQFHGERLIGVCNPSKSKDGACLAEITVPVSYWQSDVQQTQKQQKTANARVSYAITRQELCTDSAFLSTSDKTSFTYLSDITLIPFGGSYDEVTNDNVATIQVPQEPVYPNSKIYIPVKFNYNSDYPIAAFSVRMRVRHGIRILGAQISHPSKGWQISVDLNPKQTTATVTAFLRDYDVQQDSQTMLEDSVGNVPQEVYSWLIEVDENVDISIESGRIVWQLLYITESSPAVKHDFEKEAVKLSSSLDIQKDDVLEVLAITKSPQLINTACLTGRLVSQPMRVYMVSYSGRVSDVTLQSLCHSSDESILKVSPSCTSVYLDGSEVRGSQNATILIKYGTFTGSGNFIVWMPKLPLDVITDDPILSQIKSWKTAHIKRKHYNTHSRNDNALSIESDDSLPHFKSTDAREDVHSISNHYIGCRLRYQQTRIEAFARFYSTDHNSGREASLLRGRLAVRVTHLVMPFMRVSDPRVLILRGNIAEGINVGRSDVQIISPITGHVMGSKEIRVASNKEMITHMEVNVVSGLDLHVKPDESLSHVWEVKTILLDTLTKQYEKGLLDIRLHFSDSTSTSLSDIASSDYNLSVDTFDGSLAFSHDNTHYPHIIALSAGKAKLLCSSLELSSQCQRKRTQPIAMKCINVTIDFSTSSLQNDALSSRKLNLSKTFVEAVIKDPNGDSDAMSGAKGSNQMGIKKGPTVVAHHRLIHRSNIAPLEVGMYSILAVFGVAVLIFVVVAYILSVKLKYKSPPETITTTRIGPISATNRPIVANANEWVWLGKATLERNAMRTNCTKTLMPQKDFNGNVEEHDSAVQTRIKNANHGNANSNRMSGTSEISIRITTNPNPADDMDIEEDSDHNEQQNSANCVTEPTPPVRKNSMPNKFATYTKPPPIPPHRSRNRNINLNELAKRSANANPPPIPPHRNLNANISHRALRSKSQIYAESQKANLHKKADWDEMTKKLDMDYKQLMEYFENLKESNA